MNMIKPTNVGARHKSRLMGHDYGSKEATSIAANSPAIQHFAQLLVLSLAACFDYMRPFRRDITHAYPQSISGMKRDVYILLTAEMSLPSKKGLSVMKPLYGKPESALSSYSAYADHHTGKLGRLQSQADRFLLYKNDGKRMSGMVILQVDDSLIIGCKTVF